MFPFRKKPFDARAFADEQLLESLQTFDLPAQIAGDVIHCGLGAMQVRCADVEVSGEGRVASLIVDLLLKPGVVLRENVADVADNARDAIKKATFIWLMSVFSCAAAFHDAEGHPGHLASSEDVTLPDADGAPQKWRIISSPQMAFHLDDGNDDASGEQQKPPPTWDSFGPIVEQLARERRVHALKVLIVEMGETRRVECSVNGAPAPEVAALFEAFAWKPAGGATLRQFHLMVPIEAE